MYVNDIFYKNSKIFFPEINFVPPPHTLYEFHTFYFILLYIYLSLTSMYHISYTSSYYLAVLL